MKLLSCPYCHERFIDEESLVCERCKSQLDVDLLLVDIDDKLKELEKLNLVSRLEFLKGIRDQVQFLINKNDC